MFMNVLLGILSEVILSVGIIFIILLDIFLNDSNSKKFISRVSLSVLLLSILSVVCNINYYLKEQFFLNSNIILDNVSVVFKLLFLFGGIVTIFISKSKNFLNNKKTGEFYTLLLGAILGAIGSVIMELANRNDMYETVQEAVQEEVVKQLDMINQEKNENEEES